MATQHSNKTSIFLGIISGLGVLYWLWHPVAPTVVPVTKGVLASVVQVQKEKIDIEEELPGRIVPYQIAEIRPQVTGIVLERLFEEGAHIQAGDQLYQIDPTPYEATYSLAKAQLIKAQANLQSTQARANRYTELVTVEAVSKQDYDDIVAQLAQAKADITIAKANVETAKINVDYTKVYAPISGYIGKSEVTKGALVTENQSVPIAKITQLDPVFVDLMQSSSYAQRLRTAISADQTISVNLWLENTNAIYPHEGTLQFAEVLVDQTTDSVGLRGLFPNPEGTLLPGSFVRARIKIQSVEAILLPQRAVIFNPDGSASVWTVDAQYKVSKKPIVLERTIGNKWLVTEGLSEGTMVVTEGFQRLQPGALINPTPTTVE